MPENISTYWAKNVKIKTLRGNRFEFVLNVRNEDGSDYSFPEGHVAFFAAFKNVSNPVGTIMPTSSGAAIPFKTLVEEGKITVNTLGGEESFYPIVGTYSYILFTYNPNDVGVNLEDLMENVIPNWHLRVGWMSDELTDLWTNPYETDSNILQNGYYDEWFHIVGDEGLYPCFIPEWKLLQANQESGSNLYYSQPLIDFPYINNDYLDNNDVWSNNKLTYQNGMEELVLKTIIHRKNIVKCIFDERQYLYKWSVVPIPVRYNSQCSVTNIPPPATEIFPNASSWTNIDGDSYTFHTGNYPFNFSQYVNIDPENSEIATMFSAQELFNLSQYFDVNTGTTTIDFATIDMPDTVINLLPFVDTVDEMLSEDISSPGFGLNSQDFSYTGFSTMSAATSSFMYATFNYFYEQSLELSANYVPGDLLYYPINAEFDSNTVFSFQMYFSGLNPEQTFLSWGIFPYGNGPSANNLVATNLVASGYFGFPTFEEYIEFNSIGGSPPGNYTQGLNDWRRIKPEKVGLPYAPIESLDDLDTLLSPPPMGVSDYFTVMFGGASLEYPDAFPWWSYYQTGGTGNINVPYVSNYSAIFAEGAEITDSWLPFYSPQSLVDWNEDYLIFPKTSYFVDMFNTYPELGHIPTDAIGIEEPTNVMLEQLGNEFPISPEHQNLPVNTNTPGWNLIPYLGLESTLWNYLNYTNEADLPGFVLSGGGDVTYWGVPIEDAYEQTPTYNEYIFEYDGVVYDYSSWSLEPSVDENGFPILNTLQEQQAWYGNNQINDQGEPTGLIDDNLTVYTPFASPDTFGWSYSPANEGLPPIPNSIVDFVSNTPGLDGTIYDLWWNMSSSLINSITEVSSVFSNQIYLQEQSPVTAFDIGINNGLDFQTSSYSYNNVTEDFFNQSYAPQFDVYISGYILNAMAADVRFYQEGTNIGTGQIHAFCRITRPDGTGFPVKPEFNTIYGEYEINEFNQVQSQNANPSNVYPYGLGKFTEVYNLNNEDVETTIIPIAKAHQFNFKPAFDGSVLTDATPVAGQPGAYEFLFRFVTPFGGSVQANSNTLESTMDTGWDYIDWDNAGDRKFVVEYRFANLKTMSPPFVPEIKNWIFLNASKRVSIANSMQQSVLKFTGYEDLIGRANYQNISYSHWSMGTSVVFNGNFPEVPNPDDSGIFGNDAMFRIQHVPTEGAIIKFFLEDIGNELGEGYTNVAENESWDYYGYGGSIENELPIGSSQGGQPSNIYDTYDYFNPYFNIQIQSTWEHTCGRFGIDINRLTEVLWDGAPGAVMGAPTGGNYSAALWGVEINPEHYPIYQMDQLPNEGESLFKVYNALGNGSNSELPPIFFDMYYLNEETGETGIVEIRQANLYMGNQMAVNGLSSLYNDDSGPVNGTGDNTGFNIETPLNYQNWNGVNALDDTPYIEQVANEETLLSNAWLIPRSRTLNTKRIFWHGATSQNTEENEIITSYYGMTYNEINSNWQGLAGYLSLSPIDDNFEDRGGSNNSRAITAILPQKPEWHGNPMKFWFESREFYKPRIIGGPPPELGGTNPYWQAEEICLRAGGVFRARHGAGEGSQAINAQNCLYTDVFWTPEIMAEWPTDPESGLFIPTQHPNGSGQLIYGKVYAYWLPPGRGMYPPRISMLSKSIRRVNFTEFLGTDAQSQPSRVVERKGELRVSGTAMTMDLMKLTINEPPEYNLFEYTVKITKANDPEFIYDTFDIDASVPFPENFENYDWSQPTTVTNQTTIFLGEMGIPDGQELQFYIKPKESYRQFDTSQESYIRLAGTYFSTTWGNNSYLSEDVLTPVKANYWLYGDFVVNKNNENE